MSRTRITVFISILVASLCVTNLVLYEALAQIFSITVGWQLVVLGIVLAVLSMSFIASRIFDGRYYNWLTRLYSLITSVWMGFFVYLFFASCIYGVLAVAGIPDAAAIGVALLICAFVASVYGILHSRNIQVSNVDVALENLPAQWVGRKIVWISDLHLGQIYGSAFTRRVVDRIKSVPHDIIFIGGDLYDGTTAPDLSELIAPLKELSAPHGVYYITGNHEEFGSSEKFITAVKAAGIEVVQDRMIDVDGLQLIGVDYHTTSDTERFKKILSDLSIDTQKASVLMKHVPNDLEVARAAGISLQISGHTHSSLRISSRM